MGCAGFDVFFRAISNGLAIIMLLVFNRVKGLAQLLHLSFNGLMKMIEKVQPLFQCRVAFQRPLHEGADIFNRHASSFETVDHFQRAEIVVVKTANPGRIFLEIGNETFFIIVADGGDGEMRDGSDLANRIRYGHMNLQW